MPTGWEEKTIGEVAEVATGTTPPTADLSNYGDEFMFVSPADIGESKWIDSTGKRLSSRGFAISRRFPSGSVLFVCIGSTIGKCAIAKVDLTSNQQINAILPNSTFDSEFLYYCLSRGASAVKAQAGEQAVPLVNKTQFSATKLVFPPRSEQRAIATALSDVDALIAGLERLIAKKRDIKRAAMQQLLTGQTRLPGFSGEWIAAVLGDLVSLYQPITISAKQFTETGYPVYGANGIVGSFHLTNHETWQVTVTCRGSTCGTVNRTVDRCWITGNAMVLNCDQNHTLDKEFFIS